MFNGPSSRRRILAILEGGDRYPSGVVRGTIFREMFQEDGLDVEFISRTPLEALDLLEHARRPLGTILRYHRVRHRFLGRAWRRREAEIMSKAHSADVVYLSKVSSLPFVRSLRRATSAPVILDFGDAVWLYDDGRAEESFQELLQLVDEVTTDNEATAAYVRRFNSRCTVIPDSPQLEAFDIARRPKPRADRDRGLIIGWIGSPGTAYNLYAIWEALEEIGRRYPGVQLRLVGTGEDRVLYPHFENIRFTSRPSYDQASMVDEVLGMHIGLFPLQDVGRSHVRGVLKAAIYMCGEAAVVASPVGQIGDVIHDGENGMLARERDEWVAKIGWLIENPQERERLTAAALNTVRNRFRTRQSYELLKKALLETRRRE
jgi:glycosyltransferase involved in cell wall biosynthesis